MTRSLLQRIALVSVFAFSYGQTARAQVNITTPDTTLCSNTVGPVTLNAIIGSSSGNFVTFTDDIYSGLINLGFPFTFYGNTYTQCVLSSNGFISFNLSNEGQYSPYSIPPAGGVPGNVNCLNSVMGAYSDIDPSQGGTIEYSTQGVAPNRRFVVTFCDVPMFSCTNLLSRFQIVLFETTNTAEVHISNMPNCPTWNGGAAIEGVQNATGTSAVTVPGRNYPSQWTATNSSHRFSPATGNTYQVDSIGFLFYPTGLNNIIWYQNGVAAAIGTGNSITVTPTAPSQSYIATAQGCIGSSSDTVTVNVGNPLPLPTVTTPIIYCQNDQPAALTAGTAPGATAVWYTTPVGGTALPSSTPIPSTATPGSTFYYVSQTAAGCESSRATVQIAVKPAPDAVFVLDRDTICQDETAQLTFTGIAPPGTAFAWNFDNARIIGGAGAGPYTLDWEIPGVKSIRVDLDANGCVDSAFATVRVKEKPLAGLQILLPDACVGDVREVRNTIVGGPLNPTFNWDFAGGEIVSGSDAGPYTIRWTMPGDKVVTLITEKEGCFSDPATDTIPVYPLPLARIQAQDDRSVCLNDTLQLLAAAGDATDVYRWQSFSDFVPANYINNTRSAQYIVSHTGYVTLQVLSQFGCEARDSVYFNAESCCQVFIPTAFSPNGDGKNDWFRIFGTERSRKVVSLQIVNRWGQVVWREQNGRAGWNGLYNGVPQEAGVYHYLATYECPDGKVTTTKGDVMLIR